MAKKRKASSQHQEATNGPNLDVGESRKRIRNFEDVADSDDEFHINRDKILLDEAPDAKRRRKHEEQEEFLEQSDEEVLGYAEDDEDEDGEAQSQYGSGRTSDSAEDGAEAGDDEEEGVEWGMTKGEIYGADAIETEEQALEEEAEALRLQKKQLQSMTAADYGFDETEWQETETQKQDEDDRNVVTEVLPQLQLGDDLSSAERQKILRSRYPEFEPLSNELIGMEKSHAKLTKELKKSRFDSPNAVAKHRAASAYVGALTMYFALMSSPISGDQQGLVAMSATQLRNHPVMDTLVKCKELWGRVKDLPADVEQRRVVQETKSATADGTNGVDASEPAVIRVLKKSRAQKHAEAALAATEARKAERMQRTERDLADLDALVGQRSVKRRSRDDEEDSDIGDEAPLTALEAAEKAKRKKSLRFYTSQIAQKASKRGTAGRNAGGDDDIPYRERLKDRQARLNAEAEKRGRRTADAGAELGGASDDEDARQAATIRGENNDYYDLIASRTAQKKSDKAALNEARKLAELQGGEVVEQEVVGPDGKRKVTYMIEKNKGLTPHRKKESRNPRVKKRKKFEEKKKKLGSIKPVYKGGEGRGGYGGELTGIKKGLVKSTKL